MTDIFAHRGSVGVPTPRENTIAASDKGADGVELDVWQTAGGEFAVQHDRHVPSVGAVTNAPTLAAALDACATHGLAVNVELKGCRADAVAGELEGRPGRILVSSFHPESLADLRRTGCDVPLGLLVDWRDDPIEVAALGCATLHPFVTQVDADLEAMALLGVAAVITDRVLAARAAFARVGRSGGERKG